MRLNHMPGAPGDWAANCVVLSTTSWYGHPEGEAISKDYTAYSLGRRTKRLPADSWRSGLRCWMGVRARDPKFEGGDVLWRGYEPTEKTPRWVWVGPRQEEMATPPVDMETMQAMIVEYRLRGGADE